MRAARGPGTPAQDRGLHQAPRLEFSRAATAAGGRDSSRRVVLCRHPRGGGARIPPSLHNPLHHEVRARPGHMIGLDDRCMAEGMSADYIEIARLTERVNEIVKEARTIDVQAPSGTDMRASLD